MRKVRPIALHFQGALSWQSGLGDKYVISTTQDHLACCSGARAARIFAAGHATRSRGLVTCKTCLRILARSEDYERHLARSAGLGHLGADPGAIAAAALVGAADLLRAEAAVAAATWPLQSVDEQHDMNTLMERIAAYDAARSRLLAVGADIASARARPFDEAAAL